MKNDFAKKLMERPYTLRWVTAIHPISKKPFAGLLLSYEGDNAVVIADRFHHRKMSDRRWNVRLSELRYR